MTLYEKVPGWLKAMIGGGLLLIGPAMVMAFWFWGISGGIVAVLSIMIYFTVLYIVCVRRYLEK
jgi:hypothetical protein